MAHSYSEDSGICDLTCLENHSAPAWPQEMRSYMALCIRAERTCMNMREHALNRHQEQMYTEVWRRGGSSNCASWQAGITHWMEQEKLWKYRRQFSLLQFLVCILTIVTRLRRPAQTFLHEWASIGVFSMGRAVLLHYSHSLYVV